MVKVSVIVPIFNSEEYLDECLKSALNQSLKDIEIICVDDGSSDASLQIVRRFAKNDGRIKVITKPNAGTGHTMNTGFKAAAGEYLAILESDDIILPGMLEDLYAIAKGHGNLDFVKSDFYRFWGNGGSRKLEYVALSNKKAYYNKVLNPSMDISMLRINNVMATGIYKRSFIEENKILYNETPGAAFQDNGFWFQVFLQAKSAFIVDKAYYMIRRDNENSSVKSKSKVYCMCDEYDYIRSFIKRTKGLHPDALYACSRYRYSNYIFTLNRIDESFKPDFLLRFSNDFKLLSLKAELSRHFFTARQWKLLCRIIENPLNVYFQEICDLSQNEKYKKLKKEFNKKKKELEKIKSSNSWKIGRAITAVPRRIKKLCKNNSLHKVEESIISEKIETYDSDHKEELPEALIKWYKKRTGWDLDLNKPESFNEKIQWLKLYDSTLQKTRLADKYKVRDWVADKIGHDHLIPLLGVWGSFEEIDFSDFPSKFVLKTNHGSGWNVIVKDKTCFNYHKAKQNFDKWLSQDYSKRVGYELHYGGISPVIIAEEYMGDSESLLDYRFFCFDGKPYYVWVDSGSGTSEHRRNIYDINWNLQPLLVNYEPLLEDLPKPLQLEEMTKYAEILSEGFSFVRVDFYLIGETVYFGEMTFTPQSGIGRWDPPEMNKYYGDLINLPSVRRDEVDA